MNLGMASFQLMACLGLIFGASSVFASESPVKHGQNDLQIYEEEADKMIALSKPSSEPLYKVINKNGGAEYFFKVHSYDSNWKCYSLESSESAKSPKIHFKSFCRFHLGSNPSASTKAASAGVELNLVPHQIDWVMTQSKFEGTESVKLPGRHQFVKFDRWTYAGFECMLLSRGASLPITSKIPAKSCKYTPGSNSTSDSVVASGQSSSVAN